MRKRDPSRVCGAAPRVTDFFETAVASDFIESRAPRLVPMHGKFLRSNYPSLIFADERSICQKLRTISRSFCISKTRSDYSTYPLAKQAFELDNYI